MIMILTEFFAKEARGCRTKKLVRCPFFYVNVVYNLKNKSQASKTLGFMVKY